MPDTDAQAITIGPADEESASYKMRDIRRNARCCVKVAPWVSLLANIMVAVGLAVWYIYTKRALNTTQNMSQQLFGQQLYLVQKLNYVIDWIRLIMVIVVSCLLGLTVLLSALRTYQNSARLPHTSCGAPGRLSYGSYAALIAMLNFIWWLLAMSVAMLIAGTLVWLTVAFLFGSALYMGVTYTPSVTMSPTAYYTTARSAVDGLTTYASVVQPQVPAATANLQPVQNMNSNVQQFLALVRDVPLTVCPVNCLNMGSFYDALKLTSSCICSDANIADMRSAADGLWQDLVHVLAALALMGLGCLWQLMNQSAHFAHARRDLREVPSHKYQQFIAGGDAVAAIHAISSTAPSKKSGIRAIPRDQDAGHNLDTGYGNEFAATTEPETAGDPPAATGHMNYNNAYDPYQDTPSSTMPAEPAAATPQPATRADGEQNSPANSAGGRGATFSTTAQRYAAYRLRAAQAAAAKGSPSNESSRKQWMR